MTAATRRHPGGAPRYILRGIRESLEATLSLVMEVARCVVLLAALGCILAVLAIPIWLVTSLLFS